MAQQDGHARLGRKESIADIVEDLTLLKVSTDGFDTVSSMKEARDSKIQELKKANGTLDEVCFRHDFNTAPGGTPRNSWGGGKGCCSVLQILTLFQTKTCHFPYPYSDLAFKIHTRFQT